ncbi:MAG: helicase-exonuclease AddAB subunit AddA [Cellulosilyticaceae bacterium]
MGWTEGQQQAIDTRKSNVLVSAAAGSGKTAVLTERVFKRVLGNEEEAGIDIDRFLIVTFTSAAAQEMKERISNKISQEIKRLHTIQHDEQTNDIKERITYLDRQISLLGKASISTIHSFCLKTIRNYFNQLEIDPNVKVGDDAELQMMKLEILETLLEEKFEEENNEEFLKLADTYGHVRGMAPLMDLILQMHTFSKSTIFPSEWLNQMANILTSSDTGKNETIWERELSLDISRSMNDLIILIEEILKLCRKADGPALYEPVILKDLSMLQEVISHEETSELREALMNTEFGRLPGKKQDCDEQLKDRVKTYRTLVKKTVEELQKIVAVMMDKRVNEKTQCAGELMVSLVGVIDEFEMRYQKAKREKNIIDYNDLEHLCLKLFIAKKDDGTIEYTEIAQELAVFYEEIYMDEYQDTNSVQEMILSSIANSRDDAATRFMVGDMKQSIYRFRLANPLIFANKYDSYEKIKDVVYTSESSGIRNICIDLSQNFRSREVVLDATNDLFDQVMSPAVGELEYDEDARLKVGNLYVEGEEEDICSHVANSAELHLIEVDGEETDEQDTLEDLKNIELEAKMVAQMIQNLLNGKGNPSQVFDKDTETYRQIEPKDIVILLRSVRNKADLFESALIERGIAAYAEVSGPFFEAIEIQTMLSYLKLIDNPRQDIPLVTVLHSPIVGLDFDEMVCIRQCLPNGLFYDALVKSIEMGEAPLKAVQFWKQLNKYREQSALLPLDELMHRVYVDTGYERYVQLLPTGSKKKANLKLLKQYAEQFESNNGVGVFGFLQHMDQLAIAKSDLPEAKVVGESDNLVRIMTIHKSKGLEFPVVFVANTDKSFNKQDLMKSVLMHQELGFGPKYVDSSQNVVYETIPFYAIKQKISSENISEEMRMLYVAMTRAKEKLFITGAVKKFEKQLEKWSQFAIRSEKNILPLGLKTSPTYLNWIGMSLFAHEEFDVFRKMIDAQCSYLYKGSAKWEFKLWQKQMLSTAIVEAEFKMKEQLETLKNWDTNNVYSDMKEDINERLTYVYEHEKATTIPVKVAVSAMKKKAFESVGDSQAAAVQTDEKPRFMGNEKVLEATTRGTMIHAVFELVDFTKVRTKEDINGEMQRLVDEGRMSAEILKIACAEKLERFASTEMVERMGRAKHLWKEQPFVYLMDADEVDSSYPKEEKIILQGVVDTCFLEDDKLIVVDYKTDYVNVKKMDESIQIIRDRYKSQLDLYSKALEEILEKPVAERWIYLYSIDQWIEI